MYIARRKRQAPHARLGEMPLKLVETSQRNRLKGGFTRADAEGNRFRFNAHHAPLATHPVKARGRVCRESYSQVMRSSQDWRHDVGGFDAGQSGVEALELMREPQVIDTQAVEDGGVDVVHMHRVFRDVVGEVVRLAV